MDRRDVLRLTPAALAPGLLGGCAHQSPIETPKVRLPKSIKPGDTLGCVCPASPVTAEQLQSATRYLAERGYSVHLGRSLTETRYLDLAGSDDLRAEDINTMMADPDIDAVISLRGGYGCQRIVEKIDYSLFADNPKWFTGFSDITGLHLAIYRMTGSVSLHAPAFAFRFGQPGLTAFMETSWWDTLEGRAISGDVPFVTTNERWPHERLATWVGGVARGTLLGGNLSRIAGLAGTPYALPADEPVILFIEDVDESAYRLDRYITQLIHSGGLDSVTGILVGSHDPAEGDEDEIPLIERTLQERLTPLGIPILAGVPIGHHAYNMAVAHGSKVVLDASRQTLSYLYPIAEES